VKLLKLRHTQNSKLQKKIYKIGPICAKMGRKYFSLGAAPFRQRAGIPPGLKGTAIHVHFTPNVNLIKKFFFHLLAKRNLI
jgi:hypothetical protein